MGVLAKKIIAPLLGIECLLFILQAVLLLIGNSLLPHQIVYTVQFARVTSVCSAYSASVVSMQFHCRNRILL